MSTSRKTLLASVSLLTVLAVLVGCAAPTPEVIEREVIVTQIVEETVLVEGTPQVVEVEVTKIVQETVEKVVTATRSMGW